MPAIRDHYRYELFGGNTLVYVGITVDPGSQTSGARGRPPQAFHENRRGWCSRDEGDRRAVGGGSPRDLPAKPSRQEPEIQQAVPMTHRLTDNSGRVWQIEWREGGHAMAIPLDLDV